MKKLLVVNFLLMAAIVWTCWLIKLQLTSVVQAKQVPRNEIFIQLSDGRLVPYHGVKIVPIPKPAAMPAAKPKVLKSVLAEVYRMYGQYLRYGTGERYLARLTKHDAIISQAAQYYGLDPDLGRGLIAVESMGIPDIVSPENAIGLTQILVVPRQCQRRTKMILGVEELDLYNPEHNIWLGFSTLKHYTQQKDNDLMLGMVSYNFGPNQPSVARATSFASLQASEKIKSYPIRVLALTLLAKVKAQYGQALPYTSENRAKIESIVLPKLD